MANSSKKWRRGSEGQALMFLALIFLFINLQILALSVKATSDVYIVYMGDKQRKDPAIIRKSHHTLLATVLGSKEAAKTSLLYSYKYGFSGFAASLTKSHAEKIAEIPGVLHVAASGIHKLHTTRSWDFLGLKSPVEGSLLSESNMGEGTIIGVIDSGFWPESDSFDDENMGPIPRHWKGICQHGDQFNSSNCNKKVIGARWFLKAYNEGKRMGKNADTEDQEYFSPRDAMGHGTHTASTAAGAYVKKASFGGLAAGVARGGAPRAHLAIYKACWFSGACEDADVLKAYDMAIHDGVDILSVSIGRAIPEWPADDKYDGVTIGSFHANANGIICVSSAGNDGPFAQTIVNTVPWAITVAATTIDRAFPAAIILGNNKTLQGQTLGFNSQKGSFIDLVYSKHIAINDTVSECTPGNLKAKSAEGKVVLCFSVREQPNMALATYAVQLAGGVGLIYAQTLDNQIGPCFSLICATVDYEVGTKVLSYIKEAKSPVVKMNDPTTLVGNLLSPRLAYFSSRGPSALLPGVLKPDIAAPGVNILAAIPPSRSKLLKGGYALASGTSMSSPHVAGVAALIKTLHRDWSPAAIKSALVTTATQTGTDGNKIIVEESTRKPADPFDIGGGFVNPTKAADPGLIYNISQEDYVQFICSSGFSNLDITNLTMSATSCMKNSSSAMDLNLPSISIPNLTDNVTISRTVTNVGPSNSVYKAVVQPPHGVSMTVEPETLSFNATTTLLSYNVRFSAIQQLQGVYSFGSLTWSDDNHGVRIPIAVRVIKFESYSDM